jgi:hypothetical protein
LPPEGAKNREGAGWIMNKSRKRRQYSPDLADARALVAGSAIVVPAPRTQAVFSDWEKDRKSADIDALVLAWIAGHVRGPLYRGRLN